MIATARMRWLPCVVVALALAVARGGAGAEINRIMATVDGDPITLHEYRAYVDGLGNPPVPDTTLLDTLITEKLLEKEAAVRGVKVREEDVDAYVEQVRARSGLDGEAFEAALATQGYTLETYRARVRSELVKTQLVNLQIRARVNVPDEDVERYYETHKADYRTGGGRVVRDIFLPVPSDASEEDIAATRALADDLAARARSRRAFARLAREHSQGPGAEQGGLIGTFEPGHMQAELDAVVFQLEPGQVSAPVRTATGFHVLRVDQEVDATYRPLDEVEEEIRAKLYEEALEERYQDWLARDLRESHQVEVLN